MLSMSAEDATAGADGPMLRPRVRRPVSFDNPNERPRGALRAAGFDLKALVRAKKRQPTFETILGQRSGIFLVEFYWRKPGARDWHAVAVNCDQRRVICNTLGVVPFHRPEVVNESADTLVRCNELERAHHVAGGSPHRAGY